MNVGFGVFVVRRIARVFFTDAVAPLAIVGKKAVAANASTSLGPVVTSTNETSKICLEPLHAIAPKLDQ